MRLHTVMQGLIENQKLGLLVQEHGYGNFSDGHARMNRL